MSVKFNPNEFLHACARIEQEMDSGVLRAANKFSDVVEKESINEAPVDTGNLRGSFFRRAEKLGRSLKLVFGFSAAYAWHVHENTWAHHAIGKAQYLADPIMRNAGKLLGFLKYEIEGAMRTGGKK